MNNRGSQRIKALNLLKNLSEAEFREVVFNYHAPQHYLPSSSTPLVMQAIAILEYAERQGDPQLTRMLEVIAQITGHDATVKPTENNTTMPTVIASIEPQKILVLAANPKMDLRLDVEIRAIENGLQRSQFRERFEFVSRQAVRSEDLRRAFLDLQPAIVQFSGHGQGEAGIWLQSADGTPHAVQAAALAQMFALFSEHVECVLLNACDSIVQAEAIAEHIPHVIGMRGNIGDNAASIFATGFYDALGAGRDYAYAFKMGQAAVALEGLDEPLEAVLFEK